MTWDVQILTLRLNYVAGYTDPLLFLFERTYDYYVDNRGLCPGGSVVWASSKFGRPHR